MQQRRQPLAGRHENHDAALKPTSPLPIDPSEKENAHSQKHDPNKDKENVPSSLNKAENCSENALCAAQTANRRRYRLRDFAIGSLIGSGKYGRVFRARDLIDDTTVALKLIELGDRGDPDLTERLRREIEIQGNIRHENITQLYGFFIDQSTLYIVLEYARYGSLYDQLQSDGSIPEETVAKCLKTVAESVKHLHSHRVMHRDIKPENILIGDKGVLKLADFGWSILCCHGLCFTLCGTVDYLAPEMVEGNGYDDRVDVWSLGVLCYELLFGKPPFLTESFAHTTRRIKKADFKIPKRPAISKAARDFMKSVLVSDPCKRLDITAVLTHPFLRR